MKFTFEKVTPNLVNLIAVIIVLIAIDLTIINPIFGSASIAVLAILILIIYQFWVKKYQLLEKKVPVEIETSENSVTITENQKTREEIRYSDFVKVEVKKSPQGQAGRGVLIFRYSNKSKEFWINMDTAEAIVKNINSKIGIESKDSKKD